MTQPAAEETPRRKQRQAKGPTIVDTTSATEVEKVKQTAATSTVPGYQMPPFDLFDEGEAPALIIDETLQQQLNDNAAQLITTLNHYGVRGEIREIQPGPTVTTYEMEPEAGTKVSKIASLADDLAMSLGCQVRIIAPIPGKKRVGFEIPNRERKAVNLRELIEDRRF
ncbi:MAG TPA: DNA translocase FtsK, partial [Polyangiaceae bacterium]|nr:DNA translocase FtsK [Polyangiaceae bacterium]